MVWRVPCVSSAPRGEQSLFCTFQDETAGQALAEGFCGDDGAAPAPHPSLGPEEVLQGCPAVVCRLVLFRGVFVGSYIGGFEVGSRAPWKLTLGEPGQAK